jgi:O-antigen/teichoic acid export membrane protein
MKPLIPLLKMKSLENYVSPTRFLALCNIINAGLGFVVGAYIARVLGPERLGITAVINGINSSINGLIDVRLNDVAAKAFYQHENQTDISVLAYQSGIVWITMAGTIALSILVAALSALIGNFLIPYFTGSSVARWWLPLNAVTMALSTIAGTALFLLRFTRNFYAIGIWRVAMSVISMLITITVLRVHPNISGQYLAGFYGGVVNVVITVCISWYLWNYISHLPMLKPDWRGAITAFRRNLKLVFYGNLLGYSKLLQRSADTLLVARFTNDRETGFYKFTRTFVDSGLAILQDALYQVYYPAFLQSFAQRAKDEYHRLANRLLRISGLITLLLLAGGFLILPWGIPLVFGQQYRGVEWPIIVFSSEFIFIVGCYPWLWALFVASGDLMAYTITTFVAVGMQYAIVLALFHLFNPSALSGVLGALSYYFVLIPIIYTIARKRWSEFLPTITTRHGGRL